MVSTLLEIEYDVPSGTLYMVVDVELLTLPPPLGVIENDTSFTFSHVAVYVALPVTVTVSVVDELMNVLP